MRKFRLLNNLVLFLLLDLCASINDEGMILLGWTDALIDSFYVLFILFYFFLFLFSLNLSLCCYNFRKGSVEV